MDLFREAAAKYPDRPAVRDEFGDFTYRELDKMSDYVAQRLTENGFGPEQATGILCGRTKEYAIAYVGVMRPAELMFLWIRNTPRAELSTC